MEYTFTLKENDFDLATIHAFLKNSYWAKGVAEEVLAKALKNSLCFGVTHAEQLVAFGRFITDRATFAYLADVFVLPEHRGKGLAKMMLREVLKHSDLQGLRRMMLATSDAHNLYRKFDFEPINDAMLFMQKLDYSRYDLDH